MTNEKIIKTYMAELVHTTQTMITAATKRVSCDNNAVNSAQTKEESLSTTSQKQNLSIDAEVTTMSENITSGDIKRTSKLCTPSTPHIELSRASSSSYQEDSRDSSPENVFEQVGTGTLQETIDLRLQYDDALELRDSIEVLQVTHLQHKEDENAASPKKLQQGINPSPQLLKNDEPQKYLQHHQRKDSASSEVAALLCISGRSSRVSSVCSQGSAISHLSAASAVSRSPSPHRMLLETSFCGPKPVYNVVESSVNNLEEPPTTVLLEKVLLSRIQDPTEAVLAEPFKVKSTSKIKQLPITLNADDKDNLNTRVTIPNNSEADVSTSKILDLDTQTHTTKAPGHIIVGKTAYGTDYIRINLKPRHMYNDKGIAPHEKIVHAPNTLGPIYASNTTEPSSRLNVTQKLVNERHSTSLNQTKLSRSPSPVRDSVSRKSSFSSLFRFGGKDSPDVHKERSRSKSKDPPISQSQTGTPSKQKSIRTIFKSDKRCSSTGPDGITTSKTSSPDESQEMNFLQNKYNTPAPVVCSSNSNSRLRYYEDPSKCVIHIPLRTPPEEKEIRKTFQNIQKLNTQSMKQIVAPITVNDLVVAAAALKPVASRKESVRMVDTTTKVRHTQQESRLEKDDAIKILKEESLENENNLSNRNTFQPSSEKLGNIPKTISDKVENVKKDVFQKNSTEAEICWVPFASNITKGAEGTVVQNKATIKTKAEDESAVAKEKRRLLFATRLGSGSQEQMFSTQFSISKTESLSSQISEEHTVESLTESSNCAENIRRQSKVVHSSEAQETQKKNVSNFEKNFIDNIYTMKNNCETRHPEKKRSSLQMGPTQMQEPLSSSENDKVNVKKSFSSDEQRFKSRTSEDDQNQVRNFDAFKEYKDNMSNSVSPQFKKQPSKCQIPSPIIKRSSTITTCCDEMAQYKQKPMISQEPHLPTEPSLLHEITLKDSIYTLATSHDSLHYQCATSPSKEQVKSESPSAKFIPSSMINKKDQKQLMHSTDEQVESSESERNSTLMVAVGADSERSISTASTHISVNVYYKEDHESTSLVTQESFEEELPYIPTTLPEERAKGVSLIPMKERANMELKTCPLERPRSTTPLNPSQLEEYCGILSRSEHNTPYDINGSTLVRGEKLRISLPRRESKKDKNQIVKSPLFKGSGKSWFEFAEQGLGVTGNLEPRDSRKLLQHQMQQQYPNSFVQVKGQKKNKAQSSFSKTLNISNKSGTTTVLSSQRKLSGHWIDFENIPEKRKPPKRITTLPKDGATVTGRTQVKKTIHNAEQHGMQQSSLHNMQRDVPDNLTNQAQDGEALYNYVKQEDCHCECHELNKENNASSATALPSGHRPDVDMLPQGDDTLPLIEPEVHEGIYMYNESQICGRHIDASNHTQSTSAMAPVFSQREDALRININSQLSNK